jgi:hypothetical protein
MKKVFLILPLFEFDEKQFYRTTQVVNYRWNNPQIVIGVLESQKEYYAAFIADKECLIIRDGNLTSEFVKQNCFDEIVILRNKQDENPPITWNGDIGINVYRPFLFGYGGLRCVGKDVDKRSSKHIFQKMGEEVPEGFLFFPHGYMYKGNNFGDLNEIGFRLPSGWQQLAARDENSKVISFVGGSSTFDVFAMVGERFSDILESMINDYLSSKGSKKRYTVLNFGMPGNVILNEMTHYMLYIWGLKTDILIAHDGYNDLNYGQSSDSYLQFHYDITYQYNYERWAKDACGSDIELDWENNGFILFKNNSLNAIKAYYNRKKQFEKMVKDSGSIFVSALQPALFSKKISDEEKRLDDAIHSYELDRIFTNMPFIYKRFLEFLEINDKFDHFIDFHTSFSKYGKEDTLFGDIIHTLKSGNEVIAKHYFDFLLSKGLIDV